MQINSQINSENRGAPDSLIRDYNYPQPHPAPENNLDNSNHLPQHQILQSADSPYKQHQATLALSQLEKENMLLK